MSGECAVVIKEWDVDEIENLEEYLDENDGMIAAFDLYGPLHPGWILSKGGYSYSMDNPYYKAIKIRINGYSTMFYPNYRTWRKLFANPFVANHFDLARYLAIIFKDIDL